MTAVRTLILAMSAILSLYGVACFVAVEAKADAAAGRKVMGMCQVCHGKDGIAKLAEAPNLAGQKEAYLAKSLHDYKSGARKHEQMTIIAATLSDDNIADVSAYYASIQVTVTVPQ